MRKTMSDGRLDVTYYGMRPATRADWDALRSERDAWKARAERLISDAADIQRYWQDEGVRGDGFCFSLNCLLRDAGLEEPLDALAEPQPPAEPTTADHPWFAWLPPTASVHRNCCDRPQSEHPPGDIVSTLDQAGANLISSVDELKRTWEALCDCVNEFEPEDMAACSGRRDDMDAAILGVLKARDQI
jgi:hypothetical protein